MASRAFDVPIDEVNPELRRRVKAMSYGLAYGLSAYGLSAQLKISTEEAKTQMEQYFDRSFKQANNLPIGHYEYANALTYVYGDDERDKALKHLKLATQIKPINAMEALEVAHAKKLLAGFEQSTAQR